MAEEAIRKQEIVPITLQEEIPERKVCLVYDPQHPLGAAARQLKAMLKV